VESCWVHDFVGDSFEGFDGHELKYRMSDKPIRVIQFVYWNPALKPQ
jgi:hypothetical protein